VAANNETKVVITAEDRTAAAFSSITRGLHGIESSGALAMRSLAGIGLTVSAVSMVAFIKGTVDAQDHLLDLSKTTRLSVEQLAGLSSAAQKSGSDLDGTAKAINKLAVEMGKDSEKFKQLGITAKDPLQAFAQLADVMNAIDDPQKRAAVGSIALGKGWESAAPLLAEGGKAILELVNRGTELSKVTTESAKRADEFNEKWTDIKTIAGGWGVAIADPIVGGLLKIQKALALEVGNKPGSIANFLFGDSRSKAWSGKKDALGLPDLTPDARTKPPGKPTGKAVNTFIGGNAAGGASRARRAFDPEGDMAYSMEEAARKASRDFIIQQQKEEDALDARAKAMDEAHMARMEQVRIESEGEEAVREHMEKTTRAMEKQTDLEDAVLSGRKLGDVLDGLAKDIARIFLRKQVTEPLGNMASQFFGSMDLSSIFSGFGGARAGGGPVAGGTAYLVGEQGPELFVPGSSGGIIPNGALGGGGVNVTIINQTPARVSAGEKTVDGKKQLVVMIEDVVSGMLAGGGADAVMGASFGARRVGVQRG
jgi:hypothetical protein